jgi:hypothetical protein
MTKREKELRKRLKSLPIEVLGVSEVDRRKFPVDVEPGDTVRLSITDFFGEHTILKHEVTEAFTIEEAVVFSFKDTEDYTIGYGGYFAQRKK